MKNFGSISEHSHERSMDLLRAYFLCIESCKRVRMPDIFDNVINMPATRFWVSSPRTKVVIAAIESGDDLSYMRPNKKEMFFEIHRRVKHLQSSHPNRSLSQLVDIAIVQPAPKFYLSASSAKIIILKARKKWFQEKSKRLQRLL